LTGSLATPGAAPLNFTPYGSNASTARLAAVTDASGSALSASYVYFSKAN